MSAPLPATDAAPSVVRAVWRGLRKRCPWCGEKDVFRSFFQLTDACPRCGLRFHRHEGQMSGDIGINTVVSFGVLFVILLGGALLGYATSHTWLYIGIGLAATLLFPLWFMPRAKTLWLAIDLLTSPDSDRPGR